MDTSEAAVPTIGIGMSGWNYRGWRGVLHPPELAQRRELEAASRQLGSIEINGSFYSLQAPGSYRRWYEETPPDLVFAMQGSHFVTHMKKPRDVRVPLASFLASGLVRLQEKLGAIEVRHHGFLSRPFIDLLRRRGVALVFADRAGIWPCAEEPTAPFVHLRLHGARQRCASGQTGGELDRSAARVRAWTGDGASPDCVRNGVPRRRARAARRLRLLWTTTPGCTRPSTR